MTTPNPNAPAPGAAAPAPAPPPSASPPAPAAPAQSSGGGGGSDAAEYWRVQAQKAFEERDQYKGKVREYEERDGKDLASELEAVKQELAAKAEAEAAALGQLQEHKRMEVRRQFVDAILSRVPDGRRDEVRLMLSGLEKEGQLSIPDDDPVKAAEAAMTQLADRYPGWFSGGSSGPGKQSGPGVQYPGEWNQLTPEQQETISDEDFSKFYGRGRPRTTRKTFLG